MTDEQWSTLTRHFKVPGIARALIENELDLYARVAAAAPAPSPSEVRNKLEHAAALASKLLQAIEAFGPKEREALSTSHPVTVGPEANTTKLARLIGHLGATPRFDAHKRLAEQHAQLFVIRDCMTAAAESVTRGKTRDASNVRALVRRVSGIIDDHIGVPLSMGSDELDFAEELGKIADPPISYYSVEEAVKLKSGN